MRGALQVGRQGAEWIAIASPHQGLNGKMPNQFGLGLCQHPLQSHQIAQITKAVMELAMIQPKLTEQ